MAESWCVCVHARTNECLRARACAHACMHTCMHARVRARVRACTHVCARVRVRIHVLTCLLPRQTWWCANTRNFSPLSAKSLMYCATTWPIPHWMRSCLGPIPCRMGVRVTDVRCDHVLVVALSMPKPTALCAHALRLPVPRLSWPSAVEFRARARVHTHTRTLMQTHAYTHARTSSFAGTDDAYI